MDLERKLLIVSNEAKEEICRLDVITPEIFSSIFLQKAKEYNLENVHELEKKFLDKQLSELFDLQSKTSKNASILSKNTTNAIEAIKTKDETSLKTILTETLELRKELERLRETLYKDELTGVYNRKWLYDTLLEKDSEAFKQEGVLAVIDLNYFKIINDTFGHIVGDKVLVFIAHQLRLTKAKVIRYGGDEFLVVYPHAHSTFEVKKELEALREKLLSKHFKFKNAEFRVSFSIGVAAFSYEDRFSEVVDRADKDMYEDKIKIKQIIKDITI